MIASSWTQHKNMTYFISSRPARIYQQDYNDKATRQLGLQIGVISINTRIGRNCTFVHILLRNFVP